ncbi:PREDICTED: DNA-(apurinic or apyrimidinic site) lyase 2 isoform X2 [Nelumbo nucifera]|uniref:DNA-(apurinic or apyrimidinic site) endonuclease 2 n=1 Tax=Nelumbo nucifera TaxID=4432 RepID=A0A1U8Q9E6_NELNU|nr:PREDICTED: DNA-(apurinic or apyrimidinic site) lyase 2 isoform X2 [Nelumbo nucifera]
MKIVTYNVNGLRPRISQHGSLRKLLNSLDADIICVQETKLSRQDLKADLIMAEGYESFFSCTRTFEKGRVCYSGVATLCRVSSAFSSNEVALPLSAEEGFTGLLGNSQIGVSINKDEVPPKVECLEGITREHLLKVDSEGRCIITDHGHFVLYNIYGPRAEPNDVERVQFKLTFFKILQKRWESLLSQGKRVIIVGDLNIAPSAIDRCEAGPDFEENQFRRWLRSILVGGGGPFYDVFRAKHPDRKEAYTCWPQHTGAEEFNYGSRIDHILIAGSCLHQNHDTEGHNFVNCHVKECDIMTQFKRWKPDNNPRWKGGRSIKLEGSDHVPVFVNLMEIPNLSQHDTPSLSARYVPGVHGFQQTIESLLMKRHVAARDKNDGVSEVVSDANIKVESCSENAKSSFSDEKVPASNEESQGFGLRKNEHFSDVSSMASENTMTMSRSKSTKSISFECMATRKKARHSNCSQLTLSSFFKKKLNHDVFDTDGSDFSLVQVDKSDVKAGSPHVTGEMILPSETPLGDDKSSICKKNELNTTPPAPYHANINDCGSSGKEKNNVALLEWQRIQEHMQNSIPLCKGHSEPCVTRVVKKEGPNLGRRFYVCARAEVLTHGGTLSWYFQLLVITNVIVSLFCTVNSTRDIWILIN